MGSLLSQPMATLKVSFSLSEGKSPPADVDVLLISYAGITPLSNRHANCRHAQLHHSRDKIGVYFMMINFFLQITGSTIIFLILTVTKMPSSYTRGANKVAMVLIVNSAFL